MKVNKETKVNKDKLQEENMNMTIKNMTMKRIQSRVRAHIIPFDYNKCADNALASGYVCAGCQYSSRCHVISRFVEMRREEQEAYDLRHGITRIR